MDKPVDISLKVVFEDPFWVGVFERMEKGKLCVAKVTFGAEPKEGEVYEYLLKHYHELTFSPAVEVKVKTTSDNPKRKMREAQRATVMQGIGTKSQQAMKLMQEQNKVERKERTKGNNAKPKSSASTNSAGKRKGKSSKVDSRARIF